MAMAAYVRQRKSTLLSCLYHEGAILSNTQGKKLQQMKTNRRQNRMSTDKMQALEKVKGIGRLFEQ